MVATLVLHLKGSRVQVWHGICLNLLDGNRRATERGETVFWTITLTLLLLWVMGWILWPALGVLLHILLIVALVALVIRLFEGPEPMP